MSLERQIYELASQIEGLRDQVASQKAPQLAYSSIEDGAITEYDATDTPVAQYGQQFDGSHIAMPFTGPTPLQPTPAIVTPAPGALVIAWDGEWVDGDVVPTDFSRLEVHVCATADDPADTAATLYATFETPRGGEVTVTLAPGVERFVRFVARSIPGKKGPASVATPGMPGSIISSEALDAITADVASVETFLGNWTAPDDVSIDGNKLFAGTVLADSIGTNQVIARHVLAGEITAGKLAVNAVIAGNIAANAVTSGTIAAGAITTDKLDANAINGIVITGSTLRTDDTGPRIVMRPGTSSIGYGDGVLEIFSGNTSESFPAEIYTIADGPDPSDNISLYIQGPGKTGFGGRPFIQMFARDADSNSYIAAQADRVTVSGLNSAKLETALSDSDPETSVALTRSSATIAFYSADNLAGIIGPTGAFFYTDLIIEGVSVPRGFCGQTTLVSTTGTLSTNSGAPTTVLSHSFDVVAGRRYRMEIFTQPQSTVDGDRITMRVLKDGVVIQTTATYCHTQSDSCYWSFTWDAPATETASFDFVAFRSVGTGNCVFVAAGTQTSHFASYDVGT